jgi:hypothetical protein
MHAWHVRLPTIYALAVSQYYYSRHEDIPWQTLSRASAESSNDLMQVKLLERYYSEPLSRLHDQHCATPAFDSDIHYPQSLILQKLREVTDEGRVAMTRH